MASPTPRPRLGGAVDVAAVEQRAHEPASPAVRRTGSDTGLHRIGRCCIGLTSLAPSQPLAFDVLALPLDAAAVSALAALRCAALGADACGRRCRRSRASRSGRRSDRRHRAAPASGGRSGRSVERSNWRGSIGFSARWRFARSWMRVGIVELRPFGAQRRDGVVLAPDLHAQLGDPLGLPRRIRT